MDGLPLARAGGAYLSLSAARRAFLRWRPAPEPAAEEPEGIAEEDAGRQVADAYPVTMPLGTALGALASARTVFDATRPWQRDMYEHYQPAAGSPLSASFQR